MSYGNSSDLSDHRLKLFLFLDLALESYTRQLTERVMHLDLGYEHYSTEIGLLLKNLSLSYQWEELTYLSDDWEKIVINAGADLSEDQARRVKSVIDRAKLALTEVNEVIDSSLQQKAELMGDAFNAEEWAVKLFSEEVLRGTLFFSLSMVLKKMDPHVRAAANLGDWLTISAGNPLGNSGSVEFEPCLADVMHKVYEKPTVLVVDRITGEEEVPENVNAIILTNASDYPDVLAHVSVRARNLKVLLAVMLDEEMHESVKTNVGQHMKVSAANEAISLEISCNSDAETKQVELGASDDYTVTIAEPPMFKQSVMEMSSFSREHSGGKSNNLANLADKLDPSLHVPDSVVLPFRLCEYSIRNNQAPYNRLLKNLDKAKDAG